MPKEKKEKEPYVAPKSLWEFLDKNKKWAAWMLAIFLLMGGTFKGVGIEIGGCNDYTDSTYAEDSLDG